jgi:hypothetical protein
MGKYDDLIAAVSRSAPKPKYIRAFHGSPYDFDRFDASKIGTGEGAQAYGHGLYFAGNEDVARGYRNALKWRGWDTGDAARRATQWVEKSGSRDSAIDALMANINQLSATVGRNSLSARLNEEAIKYLQSGGDLPPAPSGRMYEVEIDRPESSLLDWDAPISRQPKVVQKVFGDFAMDELGDGGRIYRDIATRHGEAFDDDMTGVLANLEASKELLSEGVPGIRYLDQGSRRADQGTRNYVMFPGTEDSIRILRKFAVPGAVGAGAASGMQGEQ